MSVTVKTIDSLRDPILKTVNSTYPQSRQTFLPRNYFVGLFVAPRGGGKTYSTVKLIKSYENNGVYDKYNNKVEIRTILFSPTVQANKIFNSLDSLADEDTYHDYNEEKLKHLIEEIKEEKDKTEEYKLNFQAYKRFIKAKNPDKLSSDDLLRLHSLDFEEPEKPKYPNGQVIFLVMDDLVGSDIYKPTGKSYFRNLLLRNRHIGINILLLVQNLKSVPKSIRVNCSLFVLFKFSNKKILDDMYDEFGSSMKQEDFIKLYQFATENDHDSFVIDFTTEKQYRFKQNFNKILSIQ
jgi:hypothetical protein